MTAFADEILEDTLNRLSSCIVDFEGTGPDQFELALIAANAAHGAEILLKFVIAREYPLLLFDTKMHKSNLPSHPHLSKILMLRRGFGSTTCNRY
jgi:hypothetical protein